MIREMIPAAKTVGVLGNPDNPNNETLRKEVQTAAGGALGLQLEIHAARTADDIHLWTWMAPAIIADISTAPYIV